MRSLSNSHPKLFADEKYVPLARRVTMECHFGNPPRELQTLVFCRREQSVGSDEYPTLPAMSSCLHRYQKSRQQFACLTIGW